MIRYYCDICGNELLPTDHKRLKGTSMNMRYEVLIAIDDTWNAGQVCHECIVKAINNNQKQEKSEELAKG